MYQASKCFSWIGPAMWDGARLKCPWRDDLEAKVEIGFAM